MTTAELIVVADEDGRERVVGVASTMKMMGRRRRRRRGGRRRSWRLPLRRMPLRREGETSLRPHYLTL
jgi:hypothetical protein